MLRQLRVLCFLVCYTYGFSFAATEGAAGEDWSNERLTHMVEHKELGKIRELADEAETSWSTAPDATYFTKLTRLCNALGSATEQTLANVICLQEISGRVLSKSFSSGSGSTPEAWHAKREVVRVLLRERPSRVKFSPELFSSIRSRDAALLMLFCAQVNAAYDPDYVPKKVFASVAPPINIDSEPLVAGMDPEQIKNRESREKYRDAINLNAKNVAENGVQRLLRQSVDVDFPAIIGHMKDLYSRAPSGNNEFSMYISMGMLHVPSGPGVLDRDSSAAEEPKK